MISEIPYLSILSWREVKTCQSSDPFPGPTAGLAKMGQAINHHLPAMQAGNQNSKEGLRVVAQR